MTPREAIRTTVASRAAHRTDRVRLVWRTAGPGSGSPTSPIAIRRFIVSRLVAYGRAAARPSGRVMASQSYWVT